MRESTVDANTRFAGSVVLVIDDNTAFRQIADTYLSQCGYRVELAQDGRVGIEKLRALRPDVVLCDLRMPEVDGLAVLEVASAEMPEVPVVAMSGAGLFEDAVGALRLGAWDYLIKPLPELSVLDLTVRRALSHLQLLRDNERYRDTLERTNRELAASLRLLEEDEAAARQIQFRLLPDPKRSFGEYEFSRELVTSTHLSGDFVDYFVIDSSRIGFYLADVAGHGVSSALLTVFLKSFVSAQLERFSHTGTNTICSPRKLLEQLNLEVLRERFGKHITIFYAVIDIDRGELTYSTGGHFPFPMLVDSGRARQLSGRGLPVGLFEFARYDEWTVPLPERSTLTICSDGVLELLKGESIAERTNRLLEMCAHDQPTVASLCDALAVRAEAHLPDDFTVLQLNRRPMP